MSSKNPLFDLYATPEFKIIWNEWLAKSGELSKEAKILSVEINRLEGQSSNEPIWCKVGDLEYGHQVTPLILRLRAINWILKHPPDPRGEPMYSRPAPYKIRLETQDLIDALDYSERTAQRLLQEARIALGRKKSAIITVEEFCILNELPEDKIQQKIHEKFIARWNKIKRKHDKRSTEEDD